LRGTQLGTEDMGDKQQFSLWYFFITLAMLVVLQTLLLNPHAEIVDYSIFRTLVNQKLVTNLLVGHETITGEIKPDGVKRALSEERLKAIKYEGQKNVPFTTVRVEDPRLTQPMWPKEYSDETAHLVDIEVKKILSETHEKVTEILLARRQALDVLAKLLLEKEVIERPQLQAILGAGRLEDAA